jgi:hypothetical protein
MTNEEALAAIRLAWRANTRIVPTVLVQWKLHLSLIGVREVRAILAAAEGATWNPQRRAWGVESPLCRKYAVDVWIHIDPKGLYVIDLDPR